VAQIGLRHRFSTTSGARLGHGAHLDEELGGGGGPGDRGGVCAVVVGPRRRFSRGSGYGGNGGVKGGDRGGPGGVACGSRAMCALPNLDLMEQRPNSPALEKVDGEAGASDNVMPDDDGYDSVVSVCCYSIPRPQRYFLIYFPSLANNGTSVNFFY
jgi:hypothetical protein